MDELLLLVKRSLGVHAHLMREYARQGNVPKSNEHKLACEVLSEVNTYIERNFIITPAPPSVN